MESFKAVPRRGHGIASKQRGQERWDCCGDRIGRSVDRAAGTRNST
jgi:hypothetical protein